ncbi:30S ribosomal protein S6 [bacterium]|nr:MAG: 30S ribosomal protein S6 [bacterium]
MRKAYELVALLHPDLEIDVDAPVAKVEALVAAVGGKVTKRDNWGKKRLAYRIKRQDFAIYIYFELDLETEKVREFENTILITEEVLRHMLVIKEEVDRPDRDKKSVKPADDKETDKPTNDVDDIEGDK